MISIHRYGFECPYLFVYGFAGLVDIGTVKIHRIDQAQIHQHFSGIDSSTAVAGFTGRNCRANLHGDYSAGKPYFFFLPALCFESLMAALTLALRAALLPLEGAESSAVPFSTRSSNPVSTSS